MKYIFSKKTKIGEITVIQEGDKIIGIGFVRLKRAGIENKITPLIEKTFTQIEEYLDLKRTKFNLEIELKGTPFQKSVWEELLNIPYGEVRSYKEIAKAIGNGKAYRAVGSANNKNPVAIVVPCHRVINANGNLSGYAGGLALKEKLLNLEKEFRQLPHQLNI